MLSTGKLLYVILHFDESAPLNNIIRFYKTKYLNLNFHFLNKTFLLLEWAKQIYLPTYKYLQEMDFVTKL